MADPKIVPIREFFENPAALLASLVDQDEFECMVVFAFRKDGGTMHIESAGPVTNQQMAYCSVVAAKEAVFHD